MDSVTYNDIISAFIDPYEKKVEMTREERTVQTMRIHKLSEKESMPILSIFGLNTWTETRSIEKLIRAID